LPFLPKTIPAKIKGELQAF